MNSVKAASSTSQFPPMSEFEELSARLKLDKSLDCHEKPISHWARQGDRRLPYALLRYTVRELINTPFSELASTPGIGPKKIASLLMLLQRAIEDRGISKSPEIASGTADNPRLDGFVAEAVSESTWEDWRTTVRRHGLEKQMLGQLSPTLQDLPTVIWSTTLGEYLDYTLADLRDLKTHGEKRIHTVLEVFHLVHSVFERVASHSKFSVVLRPSFVPPIEQWIDGEVSSDRVPSLQELRDNLTLPLLNQIQIDGGDTVHQLSAGRIGIESEPESVRFQAARLDVTRARIYQLLETCGEIMRIRWPEGRRRLTELAGKFELLAADDRRRSLFEATHWLMYPQRVDQRLVTSVIAAESLQDRVSSRG